MLTLAVSHHIFLDKDQRASLVRGNPIEVTGWSVPVWFFVGNTSEPANEVFCKYTLTNQSEDYPPTMLARGYKINLPQLPPGTVIPKRLPPEQLKELSRAELDKWSNDNIIPQNAFDLLSPEEGGINGIKFKRVNKVLENGRRMNMVHTIDIQSCDTLESSIAR